MYIYKGELLAGVVIFGILWGIMPWDPMTVSETVMAGLSMLAVCFGCVAMAEHAVITTFKKVKTITRCKDE